MSANEYKIKYESIEEFSRMAYKNIACWEEQLSEIEGGLNRLLNMKSFQGETAEAVHLYLQEVHKTLLSGIRQCLQEYKVRLLLYQTEYYKIDADKDACLSEKEICQIGNHLEKQEKYLYEKNEAIKKILSDISDLLPLPVPSQETLLSDITETIKTTRTLDTDIQCYETTIEKEVTQEYGSMVESTRAAVEKYIGRTRDISDYTPGETGKVKEMAALKEKITKSNLYLQEKQTEINTASEQLKDQAIRERLGWYQQQMEAQKTVDVSQLVDNIAEYFGKSLEQVVMGNFTTDVTLLGTVSQVLLGLSGLDLPCDLRDIIADVKHCSEGEEGAAAMLVLDLVAVVPGIGAVKYADEAGTVVKGIGKNIGDIAGEVKNGEKLLKSTGEAKAVQEELEQAGKALKKVGKEGDAGKAAVKSGINSIIKNGRVSIDDLKANPSVFSGKSVDEIAQALTDAGYDVTIQKSAKSKSGAQIIKINNPGGGKNISQVQVSPGGGRHGSNPYIKISTTDQGIIKIVDGLESLYKTDGKETATIIFSGGN